MTSIGIILGIPFTLLIFACPILEIGKLELFKRTNGALTYDTNVEYTYLVLTLVAPSVLILVYFFKCNYENMTLRTKKVLLLLYPIPCIGISIAYTIFTINELKGIPFGCPNDYHYTAPQVQTACQARLANFVSMWAFIFFLIINIILVLFGISPLDEGKLFAGDGKQRLPKSAIVPEITLESNDGGGGPFSRIELDGQQRQ
ncbi:hypothetical protein C1645_769921 [Glomus cerebriforme]|uniref:MARVEL domain-containing protein n=1 Tax=Glomus cerebriforme TaxID=658196 RepID=A0A397SZI1_9GLOM|nr:hypothetical protein C1645_769921 [Glomus cerebriforme]